VNRDYGIAKVPSNLRQRCVAAAAGKAGGGVRVDRHATSFSTHVSVSILGAAALDAHKYGLVAAISDLNVWIDAPRGRAGTVGKLETTAENAATSNNSTSNTSSTNNANANTSSIASRAPPREEGDVFTLGSQSREGEGGGELGGRPGGEASESAFPGPPGAGAGAGGEDLPYGARRVVSGGCHVYASDIIGVCQTSWDRPAHSASPFASLSSAFALATSIPAKGIDRWIDDCTASPGCVDVAVLLYMQGDQKSLSVAMDIESKMPAALPRLYVEVEASRAAPAAADAVYTNVSSHVTGEGIYLPLKLQPSPLSSYSFSRDTARGLVETCLKAAADAEERCVPLESRVCRRSSAWSLAGRGLAAFGALALAGYWLAYPHKAMEAWGRVQPYAQQLQRVALSSLSFLQTNVQELLYNAPTSRDTSVKLAAPPSSSSSSSSSSANALVTNK
jgi:hypothetical protein